MFPIFQLNIMVQGADPSKDVEKKRQMEESRQAILAQILTADARERRKVICIQLAFIIVV
jgi:DNA-binding TFAR19-related protein (PDSD5 family)